MRIGVVTFPGSCDDRDARAAVASMGGDPVALWHGHGDLRAEHILFADRVEAVDALEFDPALRIADVPVSRYR